MERKVFLITQNDETYIGKVKDILGSRRSASLEQVMRDVVDNIVFGDDSGDYAVITLEIR